MDRLPSEGHEALKAKILASNEASRGRLRLKRGLELLTEPDPVGEERARQIYERLEKFEEAELARTHRRLNKAESLNN